MGNRERDEQAQQESDRQEQERQEQERLNTPRAIRGAGDDETTTTPVIVNH
jgi:hypothetical protein